MVLEFEVMSPSSSQPCAAAVTLTHREEVSPTGTPDIIFSHFSVNRSIIVSPTTNAGYHSNMTTLLTGETKVAELYGTVRVFRKKIYLEDAIGSHACSLEALHACDQWHSSRVFTPLTGWHCKLRPNTEGMQPTSISMAYDTVPIRLRVAAGGRVHRFVAAAHTDLEPGLTQAALAAQLQRWMRRALPAIRSCKSMQLHGQTSGSLESKSRGTVR
jgi:hypothetical protein